MNKYFVVATAKHNIKLKGNWYKIGETVPSELTEEEYKFAKDALNIESEGILSEKLKVENNQTVEQKIETSSEIVQVGNKTVEQPVVVEKPKTINKPTAIKRPDTSKAKPRKTAN